MVSLDRKPGPRSHSILQSPVAHKLGTAIEGNAAAFMIGKCTSGLVPHPPLFDLKDRI